MRKAAAAVRRIRQHPRLAAPISDGLYRVLLNRFPYGIIYRLLPDEIRILAVAHQHRRPGYWRQRV